MWVVGLLQAWAIRKESGSQKTPRLVILASRERNASGQE